MVVNMATRALSTPHVAAVDFDQMDYYESFSGLYCHTESVANDPRSWDYSRTSAGSLYYLHHTRRCSSSNAASIGSEQSTMSSLGLPLLSSFSFFMTIVSIAVAVTSYAPMLFCCLRYLLPSVIFMTNFVFSSFSFLAYNFGAWLLKFTFTTTTAAMEFGGSIYGNLRNCTFDTLVALLLFTLLFIVGHNCSIGRREKVRTTSTRDINGSFEIYVTSSSFPIPLVISVLPAMTVDDLKSKIRDLSGNPMTTSRLLFSGTDISGHRAISTYGVKEGSELILDGTGVGGTTRASPDLIQKFATIPVEAQNFYWTRDELIAMSEVTLADTEEVNLEGLHGNSNVLKDLKLRKMGPDGGGTRYYLPVATRDCVDPVRTHHGHTIAVDFRNNRVSFAKVYALRMKLTFILFGIRRKIDLLLWFLE